jgi:homospermidine synthase
MTKWPVHGRIDGPIVMIGFGSIGKGTLPLIERHFDYDKSRMIILDPERRRPRARRQRMASNSAAGRPDARQLPRSADAAAHRGGGQGFCVNLSVDTGSLDIMKLCRELGALYIDTVNEPWLGFYFDHSKGPAARSNYALRETRWPPKKRVPAARRPCPAAAPIPAWCRGSSSRRCVNLAADLKLAFPRRRPRGWAGR